MSNVETIFYSYFQIFNPKTQRWECIVDSINKETKKMTLTQEILDAIRTNPETVEWFNSYDNCWVQYNKEECFLYINDAAMAEWRIKPKPYEARHVVYLRDVPKPEKESGGVFPFLFGYTNEWRPSMYKDCSKKFEIIVREVVE